MCFVLGFSDSSLCRQVINDSPLCKRGVRGDLIEAAAQLVLDARASEENRCAEQGQTCSLAALYATGNMPTGLLKAHNQLDKAVDAAYGYKPVLSKAEGAVLSRAEGSGKDDAARVAFLFERYQQLLTGITKPD